MIRRSSTSTGSNADKSGEVFAPSLGGPRRRRFWILGGLLLALLGWVWSAGIPAAMIRNRAQQSLQERDFDQAWRCLATADWFFPKDPANALLAAKIARQQGDGDRLQRELLEARVRGANPRLVRREELLSLAQSGHLTEVEQEFMEHMSAGDGDLAELCDALANGMAAEGRFSEAERVLEAWERDFPYDPRPKHRQGRMQEHGQRYDEAEKSYRHSLERDPLYYPARFSLGRVLLRRRRADEAIQQFRECLKMSAPEAAQVELAAALQVRGDTDEARALLQQVLQAPTSSLNASYDAVEEQPERLKAAAEYGRLETDAGNYVVARPWLEKALEANPYDTLSRYSYAVCLRGLGEQAAAKEQFEKVRIAREAMDAAGGLNARIQRDPNDLAARLELGKLILEHESPRTGLYWIRSIFPIDANYLPAHDFLAEYFASQAADEPGAARLVTFHRRRAEAIRKADASPPP